MSYLNSNPHGRKDVFNPNMCLFAKIEISLNSCFSQNMGSKRLPPDQEYHIKLKNFFIREYLWNLSFTIHVLLKL